MFMNGVVSSGCSPQGAEVPYVCRDAIGLCHSGTEYELSTSEGCKAYV